MPLLSHQLAECASHGDLTEICIQTILDRVGFLPPVYNK